MENEKRMVDMAITPEERKDSMPAIADANSENMPKYPWGLCIRFDDDVLNKLEADISDWEVGDHFELDCEVKVTSKSENDTEGGKKSCVELQITAIGAPEIEHEENENDEGDGKIEKEVQEEADRETENTSKKPKRRPNYYFE